jgi:F0F1-type ATP synthase membrane subunit b/b'
MTHVRQLCGALVFALACGALAHAAAEPPSNSESKPVRKLGGDKAQSAELAPVAEPKPAPAMDVPEGSHEALKEARAKAHEAMQDTRAALKDAREAMKDAREQAREAMAKVPKEAEKEMQAAREEARDEMQKAREQGRDALDQAKAAVDKAREQMKQALPGLPGSESRKDQARYARRVAWHSLMNRVQRPSELSPPVREELRHHAMRMAKLQRIHSIATLKGDKQAMARCDKLLVREQTRHKDKLAHLLPAQGRAKPAADSDDSDQNEAEGADDEDQEVEP